MKTMNNAVTLSGNLGAAIEVTKLSSGKSVARAAIATNEFYRDKAGLLQKQTQWHNLVAWGDTAEHMQRCLAKGSFVIVHGKLVNRPYLDQDGNTRYMTEVQVKEFSWQKATTSTSQKTAA
jgi:single-strand DNA-binding protein